VRAIIVCVDYSDFLGITLTYNRHHFEDVLVVTTPEDQNTIDVCDRLGVSHFDTRAFYERGANFNKYAALEMGLNVLGRQGWICIMDADVLWPKYVSLHLKQGNLYTPLRRMMTDLSKPIPLEEHWGQFPIHRNIGEWAGYSQIFHASDPVLNEVPWHDVSWKHAGGGDTFFQAKWDIGHKIRPDWNCLHLGEPGKNWCGRVTSLLDGTKPEDAEKRFDSLQEYMRVRRVTGNSYDHEKLR